MSELVLDIKLDVKDVKRYLNKVQHTAVDKAAARSINRTASKVQTISRREVAAQIGLPQKKFKKNLSISVKANQKKLFAQVAAKGKEFNLIEWVTPGKKKVGAFRKKQGVIAKPYRKKKEYKGAFIGRGKSSGKLLVFKRIGQKRSSIKAMYGPSVPKTFIQKEIVKSMQKVAGKTWKKEFDHNLKYYLGKIK